MRHVDEGPAKRPYGNGCVRHRQTPRLIELLWEPLAVAALNQPIDEASGAAFAGVLRRMFTQVRRDCALGLPLKALDELTRFRRASTSNVRQELCEINSPARVT